MKRWFVYVLLILPVESFAQFEPVFDFGYQVSRSSRMMDADTNSWFTLEVSQGNLWQDTLVVRFPTDESAKEEISQWVWHERQYPADKYEHDSIFLFTDGIVQTFTPSVQIPFWNGQFAATARMSVLRSKGFPMVNDNTIEWVHEHFTPTEDPFGRRANGVDQSKIYWQDSTGAVFHWQSNALKLQSISINYQKVFWRRDTLRYSTSLAGSGGIRIPFLMMHRVTSHHIGLVGNFEWKMGDAWGVRCKALTSLSDANGLNLGSQVNFMNNDAFWLFHGMLSCKHINGFELGVGFDHHSPWVKGMKLSQDYGSMMQIANRTHHFWNAAAISLFNPTQYWTLFCGNSKGQYGWLIYLMEDLRVNNLPDVQVGVQLSCKLSD